MAYNIYTFSGTTPYFKSLCYVLRYYATFQHMLVYFKTVDHVLKQYTIF